MDLISLMDGTTQNQNSSTGPINRLHTNKQIIGFSYATILVIQSLKTLGAANVTPEIIETLSKKLSEDDKAAMLKEATESTDWVCDTIKQICGGRE